jgi:hypothetical protein
MLFLDIEGKQVGRVYRSSTKIFTARSRFVTGGIVAQPLFWAGATKWGVIGRIKITPDPLLQL